MSTGVTMWQVKCSSGNICHTALQENRLRRPSHACDGPSPPLQPCCVSLRILASQRGSWRHVKGSRVVRSISRQQLLTPLQPSHQARAPASWAVCCSGPCCWRASAPPCKVHSWDYYCPTCSTSKSPKFSLIHLLFRWVGTSVIY